MSTIAATVVSAEMRKGLQKIDYKGKENLYVDSSLVSPVCIRRVNVDLCACAVYIMGPERL